MEVYSNCFWNVLFLFLIFGFILIRYAAFKLISFILILLTVAGWLLVNDLGFFGLVLGSVYVGAVCILFIFAIITMYDQVVRAYGEIYSLLLFGIMLSAIVSLICCALIDVFELFPHLAERAGSVIKALTGITFSKSEEDASQVGQNLFSLFTTYIILAGVILLVGIVGTILLVVNLRREYYNVSEFAWRYIERRGNVTTFIKEDKKDNKKK